MNECVCYQVVLDGEILFQTRPLLCPVRFCTCISFKDEKRPQLVFSLGITPECTVAMPAQCICVLL